MDVGFDPIAFLTSIFAVWFAYTESKKNNNVIVKIYECTSMDSGDARVDRGIYTEFRVLVRNQGLSLHDPSMRLAFTDKNGCITFSFPLKRRDEKTGDHSEFSKGMIAEFSLRSYEIDRKDIGFLSQIKDLTRQNVRLVLFSQGYLAAQFRIGGRRDRLALRWNRFAFSFNRRFDRRVGDHGVKWTTILPEVRELSVPVRFFVQQITQPSASGSAVSAPNQPGEFRTSVGPTQDLRN